MKKIHLLAIDPQNDFMDLPDSALRVVGANADMDRLADFVRLHGHRLADIHVTLDSHQVIDIAHPAWWKDVNGNQPAYFTTITADDIKAGIWETRLPNTAKRSLEYVEKLDATGKYKLTIWPPHCLIGTWGHNVQKNLMEALKEWQVREKALVNYITKGSNPFTEHYGGLMAEVPDTNDPGTQLNLGLIEILQQADVILIAGEASSHCVKETLNQIIDNIGQENIAKIKILTDCTSPVDPIPGYDFPTIAKQWMEEVSKLGVELTTSTTIF